MISIIKKKEVYGSCPVDNECNKDPGCVYTKVRVRSRVRDRARIKVWVLGLGLRFTVKVLGLMV